MQEAKPSTSQDLEDPTDKIDVSVRENKAGTNRMLLTQDQSCAFEGLSLHEKDGSNQGQVLIQLHPGDWKYFK